MPKETFFNLPPGKRAFILDVAIEAFAENDYNSVSISSLVRQAGIAKGSFYQYFEDKKDLYLHLIDLAAREKADFFAAHPSADPGLPIFDYFRWMYSVGVKFKFQNSRMARISYRAVYDDAPLPEETLRVIRESNDRLFAGLIEKGKAEGHIRQDVDPALAGFVFNAVFNNLGDFMMERLGLVPEDLLANVGLLEAEQGQAIFDGVIDILEKGMGAERC